MKRHVQVKEVMRASNLLYVYVRMYQTIHVCRPVSVRVLRTAVREWACCLDMTEKFNFRLGHIKCIKTNKYRENVTN